ncbi:MAG: hypothetical protein ACRENE_23160 [Polyangiaceae bacterium]
MGNDLRALIEHAKRAKTSPRDAEEQRRSFAYGNLRIEDPQVTRAQIDDAAEILRKSR